LIEALILTTACLCTFEKRRLLTNASSFFFERDGRLSEAKGRREANEYS